MRKYATLILIFAAAAAACGQRNAPVAEEPAAEDTLPAGPSFPKIEVVIEKQFTYDKYTLADTFPYRDTVRMFQWDKIRAGLARLDTLAVDPQAWGVLRNRRNINGIAPLVRDYTRNSYKNIQDTFGVERYQGIPLYAQDDPMPVRYALDGSLVKIFSAEGDSLVAAEHAYIGGRWIIPPKYVKRIGGDTLRFDRAIFVDRTNQCIATLERSGDGKWLVRSMNPCTTGLHHPPYQKETPLGIFVVQEKKPRMQYYVDGTTRIGGFSPWASRFCNGGYVHGVPVNLPRTAVAEWSASLGTTPRSHMCVRNATSHAKYIYDWAPVDRTLVFVIE